MANESINIERVDSCELSINAKGQYSGKIKVYAEHIEDARDKAVRLAEELRAFILEVNK